MTGVVGISRARDDENVRPHGADVFDDLVDDARGVDGDDNAGRLGETAGFEETRIGGVAVIDIVTVAAVASHGRRIGVGGDIGNAMLPQQRAHDLADAAIADHDCVLLSARRPGDQFRIDGFPRR